jgi:hypothetical protein
MAADGGGAKTIVKATRDSSTPASHPIQKENSALFPVAEGRIGADEDARLRETFEAQAREGIGPDKREQFHEALARPEKARLS